MTLKSTIFPSWSHSHAQFAQLVVVTVILKSRLWGLIFGHLRLKFGKKLPILQLV